MQWLCHLVEKLPTRQNAQKNASKIKRRESPNCKGFWPSLLSVDLEGFQMTQLPAPGRSGLPGRNAADLDASILPLARRTRAEIAKPDAHGMRGRCHTNLNLRREVRKSQLGLMLPSRLATSGTRCL